MGTENSKRIYLDYAATSPVLPDVLTAMEPYYRQCFGNPSSIHSFGREARQAVDEARETIAAVLDCSTDEVFFTSGGTEGDNLAIRGLITRERSRMSGGFIPHIITTSIEHQAVYETCRTLEEAGEAIVTYLPVTKDGVVSLGEIEKAIRPETILVSVIYVSNEIGTVQPVRDIGRMLDNINKERATRIYFHTDAVQAAEYLMVNTRYLHVDLLTLSGHKFGAPKGVGILYVKQGTPVSPLLTGGLQELALRPGTENVAGIVGLGKALAIANQNREQEFKRVVKLKEHLEAGIKKFVPEILILGENAERSAAISAMIFPDLEGATVLMNLDLEGVAASSGSACSAGSLERSHVLEALDLSEHYTGGAVRFSLGPDTTSRDIEEVVKIVGNIVARLAEEK